EFERIHRHHQAFRENTWNSSSLDLEPRICMLLNRFSRSLNIQYASPSCEIILNIDPEAIVGRSFLLFIRSDDLATFVEQVDLAKSSNVVTHMKFYFQSPNNPQEVPCEAMLFGAADAMIAIMRRCKPFIRTKPMITASSDHYIGEPISTSFNSQGSYRNSDDRHLHPHGYSSRISASSCSTYPSSPTDSVSSAASSSASVYSNRPGNRSYMAPLRGITIGSINSIRNLDSDQSRLRPLMSLHVDESDIVDESTTLPASFRLRRHHTDDAELDSGLEYRIRELDLDDDEYSGMDDDGSDDGMDHEGGEIVDELEMPTGRRHPSAGDSSGGYMYQGQSSGPRHIRTGSENVSYH
ncbi:hypothetical protein BGX31_007568, partial [Mortierella sp. GBA43]